ncbi:MAG: hypothetical protein LBR33_05900 [Propionibacteriaceae bacterium]|jgi:hypothetical protein|nr:hypothetical protein [Propionibacteriaceae bacterium]
MAEVEEQPGGLRVTAAAESVTPAQMPVAAPYLPYEPKDGAVEAAPAWDAPDPGTGAAKPKRRRRAAATVVALVL